MRSRNARFVPPDEAEERLVAAFQAASETGDLGDLSALLAEDAVLYSDGGGRRAAALRPILGRDRILRFFAGVASKNPDIALQRFEPATINGRPGLLVHERAGGTYAIGFDVKEGLIEAIYLVLNPDKLADLQGGAGPGRAGH